MVAAFVAMLFVVVAAVIINRSYAVAGGKKYPLFTFHYFKIAFQDGSIVMNVRLNERV